MSNIGARIGKLRLKWGTGVQGLGLGARLGVRYRGGNWDNILGLSLRLELTSTWTSLGTSKAVEVECE